VENSQETILSFIKEATGKTDVTSIDFKEIEKTTKEKIDFKKVRGSVRMMSGKIKTVEQVEAMKRDFLALRIP